MEYRRKYYRRFGNQNKNQEEKPENNLEQNQKEIKVEVPKIEIKVNTQNVYLQKVLQKSNNVQNPSSSININSVQESLPSFKNNIHDILSTDENKQKAIKYVIQKRNSGKKGNLQIKTENEQQEESNPVLANRYTNYKNRNNIYNNTNVVEVYKNYTSAIPKKEKEKEDQENKPNFSHYYARRTKPTYQNKEKIKSDINDNNNENIYRGRKIQVSISTNNMLTSPRFEKDEKANTKRERYYNINSYRNNNQNKIKETEETKPRYKYLRGYVKHFEDEQKDKVIKKEKEKEDENINKNNQSNEVSLSLNLGKNFSFGIKDLMSNKSFGNQSSREINLEESNKFKGYKNFKIVKNNFELGQKNKKNVYSKKFVPNKQKDKLIDTKKDYIKDKVINFKLLGIKNSSVNNNSNTEAPVSRFRRKYGRISPESESTNNQNLSFKDENELITYLNKKYDQEKIIDLFKIKFQEEQKSKKEIVKSPSTSPELKQLSEQLNEEKRKNEEKEKKLKQLETNIEEQTNEIREKNIGIGKKIQEIDKLKNDITSYKKDLQSK